MKYTYKITLLIMMLAVLFFTSCRKSESKANVAKDDYEYSINEDSGDVSENNDLAVTLSNKDGRLRAVTVKTVIETTDFEETSQKVNQLTIDNNGYIESMTANDKYKKLVVRIPVEKAEAFRSALPTSGKITNENIISDDVTSEYVDITARLEVLTQSRDSMLLILDKAKTVSEILEIRKSVDQYTAEIESLTAKKKEYEKITSTSKFEITIRQVEEYSETPKTFLEKASFVFSKAIDAIKSFFEFLALAIVALIPFLIALLPVFIIILLIIKAAKKRSAKKQRKKEEQENNEN